MKKIRVTKLFRFEMAHALNGYDGPCKNIHGHSYELQVTVIGPVIERNGDRFHGAERHCQGAYRDAA
jgi:6-pyruvoyltetrahydropterin/6-carboxytetrahydropterin synthase